MAGVPWRNRGGAEEGSGGALAGRSKGGGAEQSSSVEAGRGWRW